MQNTCALKVGRLLEIRASKGFRAQADVNAFFEAIEAKLAKVPNGVQVVTAVDWRECPLMSSSVSECLLAKMTGINLRTDLGAAIASPESPILVLQFLRLVRDSHHSRRKLFFHNSELTNWLKPSITGEEFQRLGEFLAEYRPH